MDTHSAFAGHDGTDAGTRAASIKTGLGDECIEWFDVVVGQTLNFQSQTSREGNFPITEFLSSFLFPVEQKLLNAQGAVNGSNAYSGTRGTASSFE